MKTRILFLCTLLMTFAAGIVSATNNGSMNTGVYVSGKLGPAFFNYIDYTRDLDLDVRHQSSKLNVGFFGSGALGYKFPTGLRLEAEVAYRYFDLDKLKIDGMKIKTKLHVLNYMVNTYYDFNLTNKLQPFLGYGYGLMDIGCSVTAGLDGRDQVHVSIHDYIDAWQWMAGVNYKLCDRLDAIVEYRMIKNEKNNVLAFGFRKFF